MNDKQLHNFHIPVLGLGFTIDTPIKVARFGISSVISIVEDELAEKMRQIHSRNYGIEYIPITADQEDRRAKRITAYLDVVKQIVDQQVSNIRTLSFDEPNDLTKYFLLLPDHSSLKKEFLKMMSMQAGTEKSLLADQLRTHVRAGDIDVNIMSKVNKQNHAKDGTVLPKEYNDALAALRGFAKSSLSSSVIFSAGYNPELYAYLEEFDCFFPGKDDHIQKRVILKVSDFRSARTQGKILAKKGILVSEFRIESGLNCGGHAFATDGILLGPIMEEFKLHRTELQNELLEICNDALSKKQLRCFQKQPGLRISVQGGIGTANEHEFLLNHYGANSAGWGSPFLLVPEATNVEQETLEQLSTASKEDYYLSDASPLGVPFHNFRKSSSEQQRLARIEKGRPGSPCYKEHLVSDTKFSEKPLCTASRKYQHLMIRELEQQNLPSAQLEKEVKKVTEKDCLCEGLGSSAILKNGEIPARKLTAVTICPGPNLAFFSGIFSLQQMIDHIYGRTNLLNALRRPSMFVNELELYIQYFKKETAKLTAVPTPKSSRYLATFHSNLLEGISYYKNLLKEQINETSSYIENLENDLLSMESNLLQMTITT